MINKKILDMQADLDKHMHASHKIGLDDVWFQKNVGLVVEISEFVNEIAFFKYWKKNKNVNMDNVYEEFADVLHFLFSFINSSSFPKDVFINAEGKEVIEPSKSFLKLSRVSSEIFDKKINDSKLLETFEILIGIANYFELDKDLIIKHYINKNKINYERIENNY